MYTKDVEFADLERLVRPRTVAVIGASPNSGKSPGRIIPNLDRAGYSGPVYPVNPKYTEVNGRRCYPRVQDIPEPIDLAIIMVPADAVVSAVQDCAASGVKFAIILSSGFAEIGGQGIIRQQQLVEAIRGTGLRVYGPNCPGLWAVSDRMAYTFSPRLAIESWQPGAVGLVTHGGAMGRAILDVMDSGRLGFSYWFSPGNEVDLDVADFLAWLAEEPRTRVILTVVEGFRDGRRFLAAAERCRQAGKPLIVLKVGRSEEGVRAAASHTAAVSSSDRVVDAALRQVGAIRVDDIDEMIDVAELVVRYGVRPVTGVGIVTMSGGAGAITADMCGYRGVPLPALAPDTIAQLKATLPEIAAVGNPTDMTTEIFQHPEMVNHTLELVVSDPNVDAVLVPFPYRLGSINTRMAQAVVEMSGKHDKPIVALGLSSSFEQEEAARILRDARIPVMRTAAAGVMAVRRYMEIGARSGGGLEAGAASASAPQVSERTREKVLALLNAQSGMLSEDESRAVLSAYGVPFPPAELATTEEEAVVLAERVGYPVVLKISSRDIQHKTDAGLVLLGVPDANEVRAGWYTLLARARERHPEAEIRGVQVVDQVEGGIEVIVGVVRDPAFGPVVMVGLGGIFVEVLKDVAFRVAPISKAVAREMVQEIRGYALLCGARGRPPADVDALADVLERLSRLAVDLQDIVREVEINPLRVFETGRGVMALDALVALRKDGQDA